MPNQKVMLPVEVFNAMAQRLGSDMREKAADLAQRQELMTAIGQHAKFVDDDPPPVLKEDPAPVENNDAGPLEA